MRWLRLFAALAARSAIHPRDGVSLLRVGWRFRRRRWYLRPPFLPVPAMDYVRWRMLTAYGDERAIPPLHDVVRYARWSMRDL